MLSPFPCYIFGINCVTRSEDMLVVQKRGNNKLKVCLIKYMFNRWCKSSVFITIIYNNNPDDIFLTYCKGNLFAFQILHFIGAFIGCDIWSIFILF